MIFSGATIDGKPYIFRRTEMQKAIRRSQAKYKIVTSGRRSGKTYGVSDDIIEDCLNNTGKELLWVDVQYNQVLGYVEKYFLPKLRRLKSSYWDWVVSRRNLHINGNVICFRSCDKPDNIVGNGFWRIVLNEAGIQLFDNPNLWDQYVAPMMMDYPDSTAILIGTPRGTIDKDCNDSLFYKMALMGTPGNALYDPEYAYFKYSSYDNPRIPRKEIERYEKSIPELLRAQEIYGEFVNVRGAQIFREHWWKTADGLPPKDDIAMSFLSIDSAFTEDSFKKKDPSESVCTHWIKAINGNYYVNDLWHDTVAYPDLVSAIKNQILKHDPDFALIENKASGQCLIPTLKADMPDFLVRPFEPAGKDKIDRATTASPIVEAGRVYLIKGQWNRAFINQHTVFPYGNHDDIVDTTSQALIFGKKTDRDPSLIDTIDYEASASCLRGYN